MMDIWIGQMETGIGGNVEETVLVDHYIPMVDVVVLV